MKKNYKMTVAYDGTRYYGWEHQPDRDTIQGKLEAVLSRMCEKPVDVIGAGRTDAGVHAKAMTANFFLEDEQRTPEEIRAYMNRYLPEDICVLELREAAERFHARYKAVGKTYCYTCYAGDGKPVFDRKYVLTLDFQPDLAAMQEAALVLQGQHDYKSFCANPQMKNPPSASSIPSTSAAGRTTSILRSTVRAFCRTWCAFWSGRFLRWVGARWTRSRSRKFWRRRIAALPGRRRRRRGSAS